MNSDEFTPEEWGEAERAADEIVRSLREHPVANAMTHSRAKGFYERIVAILREHGSDMTVEEAMAFRQEQLDRESLQKEHE